jgi:Glycosyl hydrolases family 15
MAGAGNEPQEHRISERASQLAAEIVETQKARSDLLKWKLVLLATLGAAGLGLEKDGHPAYLLLALIPLASLYADLLCTNLNLRLIVIGTYYRTLEREPYERFVGANRRAFALEDWALYGSTCIVCVILLLMGSAFALRGSPDTGASKRPSPDAGGIVRIDFSAPEAQGWMLAGAGMLGLGLSLLTLRQYRSRQRLWLSRLDLHDTLVVHNERLRPLLRPQYTLAELDTLYRFLAQKGTFTFRPLANGLFAAAGSASEGDDSGYQFVWVRDDVHIAYAHYLCGEKQSAVRTAESLLRHFRAQEHRFRESIRRGAAPPDPMDRPHIRFDGQKFADLTEKWPHAQNDALGYFLWFYCSLARNGEVDRGDEALQCLALFPAYFEAIHYWQDRDSGHWEEVRKVSASSIGAVLAGLRALVDFLEHWQLWRHPLLVDAGVTPGLLQALTDQGQAALNGILPYESVDPACPRPYDSALLFLLYPLGVIRGDQAARILSDVTTHLQGDYGIRRYLGDSYWCADYKIKLPRLGTRDFSESLELRDALGKSGEEAQWCIFDSIVSAIYGQRYRELLEAESYQKALEALQLQTHYLNRALGQLTGKSPGRAEWCAPEAYYLSRGIYVANDHTPLHWAQANLWLAMRAMRVSTGLAEGRGRGSG